MIVIGGKKFKSKAGAEKFYKHVANMIIKEAKELTPIDTGKLYDSYTIEYNGDNPNDIYVVNYCEYAPYVHEMEVSHVIGQNKFLEQASMVIGYLYHVKTQVRIFTDRIVCYLDNDVDTSDDRKIGNTIIGRKENFERKVYAKREWTETSTHGFMGGYKGTVTFTRHLEELYDTGETEVLRY